MAGIGEIDFRRVEIERAVQHDIDRGAAGKFKLRAAREQHGGQAGGGSDAGANAGTAGAASSNSANSGAGSGGLDDGADVTALVGVSGDLAFLVGGFVAAGAG